MAKYDEIRAQIESAKTTAELLNAERASEVAYMDGWLSEPQRKDHYAAARAIERKLTTR